VVIYFCKGCERYELSIHSIDCQILREILLFINRYQQQIGQWIVAALESRELLSLCLKKLKALNKVNNNLISFLIEIKNSYKLLSIIINCYKLRSI
jgi:hypothetical protein